MRCLNQVVIPTIAAIAVSGTVSAQGFTAGVTGSTTLQGWKNPVTLLRRERVQAAVLAIADRPRTRQEVADMIADEPFDVDALVDAWLLDERAGLLYINFNLVTESDAPILERIRERHGRALARILVDTHWSEIDAALSAYDLDSVPRDVLAYVLVGAFSLDWDGLSITAAQGWRERARVRPNGDEFHVWGETPSSPDSLRGLFWGSHNSTQGELRITTFGDHFAVPRNGFPDLAWRMYPDFRNTDDVIQEAMYPGSAVAARQGLLDAVAAVMPLLRDGPLRADEIAARTGLQESRVRYLLGMLEGVGYVSVSDDGWVSMVPVLTERDVAMTRAVVMAGRKAMLAWGDAHIDEVFTEMSELTAVRHGVSREAMMTKVWHHIFAGSIAVLIEDDLLADPYAKPDGFGGFHPVVWHLDNDPDTMH